MSRFNATVSQPRTQTTNKAGGEGYASSPELELVSTMLTSFVQDRFYESAKGTLNRVDVLVDKVDPKFAAQAAVFARDKFNMRSISHVVAAEVAPRASGQPWARPFFENVAVRPDDVTEIMSFMKAKNGVWHTKAMQRGFADAFNKWDSYQLAKYRGLNKDLSLVDAVNLLHPKPVNEKAAKALEALVDGTLRQERTFQSAVSEAGKSENKEEAKAKAWGDVIPELGYMALLKNLRNIMQDAPEHIDAALARITNAEAIKKSRVLPMRFVIAATEIQKLAGDSNHNKVLRALSEAVDLAMVNVPKFEGRTLVALDSSGSMTSHGWGSSFSARDRKGLASLPPCEVGALFASMLVKANDADFMMFDGSAQYVSINPLDSTYSITSAIKSMSRGGSTNFSSVLETANKAYDRIIVLSDMQSWADGSTRYGATMLRREMLSSYKRRFNADPKMFLFNLNDYGTLLFPENNVYSIAGFSEKVFDVMELLEQDRNALVNEVRKIEF